MSDEKTIRSADDLIVQEEAVKLGKPIPEIKEKEIPAEPEQEEKDPQEDEEDVDSEEKEEEKEPEDSKEEEAEGDKASADSKEEEVDEYGTKVGKKKLYTEEEVQRMIRDRLSRGKNAPAPQNAEVAAVAKDFTPDESSSDSWQTQLEDFIETTIAKREQKAKDAEWETRERAQQAEFEDKFTSGMVKYKDFETVVRDKPITNAMMLATRSMNDPAAFIYAAAKQHPKELARIAEIQDPLAQGVEMGRLEERMKKARNLPSSPKPAKVISGDASNSLPQLDIDARIAQHAKTKIMR